MDIFVAAPATSATTEAVRAVVLADPARYLAE